MKDIFEEKGLYELEMSPEQTDFLWFLDQCGFDAKVRSLRHRCFQSGARFINVQK